MDSENTQELTLNPVFCTPAAKDGAKRILSSIAASPKSRGGEMMKKYISGQKLGLLAMALAKCAECMCWYADGLNDCGCNLCPLYPRMPYRADRKKKNRNNLCPKQP